MTGLERSSVTGDAPHDRARRRHSTDSQTQHRQSCRRGRQPPRLARSPSVEVAARSAVATRRRPGARAPLFSPSSRGSWWRALGGPPVRTHNQAGPVM